MNTERERERPEEQLPAALAADLDGSFERVVLAYQDRLYLFALRLSGSPQDAEEIAQDAFVRAYRALAGYDSARIAALALRPWLYQITLNVFRNQRRVQRLQLVPLNEPHGATRPELIADPQERPDSLLDRAERSRLLSAELAALPERYRAAVVLRHVVGFGYGELAALLEQPVGTVKANVHRGIKLLRAALANYSAEVLND